MRDHNLCFYEKISKIISITSSCLTLCRFTFNLSCQFRTVCITDHHGVSCVFCVSSFNEHLTLKAPKNDSTNSIDLD